MLEILNMNEQGRQFTQIEIDEMLDISDIYELITAFTNYMSGLINQKTRLALLPRRDWRRAKVRH